MTKTAAAPKPRGKLLRKFFLRVALPPLLPFLLLGFLGYSRLSDLVSASLVEQLAKSASTTAAKIEREVSIRQTILKKTGEDVFNIKAEFDQKKTKLTSQKDACLKAITTYIPPGSLEGNQGSGPTQTDQVINEPNGNCDPFLNEFARVVGNESVDVRTAYTKGVNTGYSKQSAALNTEEAAKIQDRLRAYTVFFPEVTDLIVADTGNAQIASANKEPAAELKNQALYARGQKEVFILPLQQQNKKAVITTGIPLKTAEAKALGSIVAAYDTAHPLFIKPSIDSAPKLTPDDRVYLADSEGNLLYPLGESHTEAKKALQSINGESGATGDVYTFKSGVDYVARGTKVQVAGWSLMSASPSALIHGQLQTAQNLALAAILISLIVSMLVGFLFVSGAVRSIKKLAAGALVFAQHKLDHKINLRTNDELETLADTLNNMATQIEAAEKALGEKNKEFINIATHELKAPMTAIIGNLSMVVDDGMGKVDKEARVLIDQAYQSSTRLRDIVNDLLDIARMEAGKAQFELVPVDLAEEVKALIAMQAVVANQQNVKLVYQPTKLPKVMADQNKLRIILTNFISNAIKYNRSNGTVTVTHKIDGDKLVTTVADTGLGIPKAQLASMFQKFFRVQAKDRANVPGTGLGLYVTKQFIERMGGEVSLESEEGKGSKFSFSLPIASR